MTLLCKGCHRVLRPSRYRGLYQCPNCGRLYSASRALESGAMTFRCHSYKTITEYLRLLIINKTYHFNKPLKLPIRETTLNRSLKPSLKSLGLILPDGNPSMMAVKLIKAESIKNQVQILLELAKDLEKQLPRSRKRSLSELRRFIKNLQKKLRHKMTITVSPSY